MLLTNVTALISGFAMFGAYVLVPRFAEAPAGLPPDVAAQVDYGFGATATMTGMYLLPGSLLMLVAGPFAGLLGRRVGSKWPLAIGMALIAASATMLATLHDEPWQIVVSMAGLSVGVGFAFAAMPALITEAVDADRDRDRDGPQHRDAHRRSGDRRPGRRGDPDGPDPRRHERAGRERLRQRVRALGDRRRRGRGDRRLRDARPPAAAPRVARDGARMSVQVSEARQVAEAVEQLLLTLVRQRHGRDPEPGSLSTFQSIALSAVADDGPLRLGTLADALGTTDATASRTVDALQVRGLAERRARSGRRARA